MMSSYFSHDSNARHDPKIMAIRAEFGNDVKPYAWFFMLLEIMRDHESDGYRIKYTHSTKKGLCLELSASMDDLDYFIKTACDIGLFYLSDDEYLCSDSFLSRMSQKDEIRQKRREAALKKWELANWKKQPPEQEHIEEKDNANDRLIFDAWNSTSEDAGLTRHNKLSPKIKTKIRSAFRDGYTVDVILKAIKNYDDVLSNPSIYYFSYKWELVDFLARGLSKFASDNCKINFLKDKSKQKYKEDGGDDVKFGRK